MRYAAGYFYVATRKKLIKIKYDRNQVMVDFIMLGMPKILKLSQM